MFASAVVYAGLVLFVAGLIASVKPFPALRIRTRTQAAAIAGLGAALVVIGFVLPAPERRIDSPIARLDEFAPVWHFNEFHTIHVRASPERVFEAVKAVTAGEIRLFRTLTWIRRFGRPGPESILNVPANRPIIEVALNSGFIRLAELPPRELVVGMIVMAPPGARARRIVTPETFLQPIQPGVALAVMNFLVSPDGRGGSTLSTETRVFATSSDTRRRFAAYWRVIYPGSAFIRRMWLRAIRARAERSASRAVL